MKGFVRSVSAVLIAAVLVISCSKDKPTGSLSFDKPAVFLEAGGEATVGFAPSANIASGSYSFTGVPAGWPSPYVDAAAQTITVVAPVEMNDETDESGSIVLTCTFDGVTASATLFVGVVNQIDLNKANNNKSANSYLATEPETNYLFDAMHKGDGVSALATTRVEVIWQSVSSLIQYLSYENGKASFFISSGDDENTVLEGNALIGAYNAAGELIWSWHIWAADYDPAQNTLTWNGYELMDRNLGALKNSNASNEDILASYGLYYQWGRKEPFIGPSTYQASSGSSATMYTGNNSRVTLKTAESSAETGTVAYATQNPLTYITTTSKTADWRSGNATEALWASGSKTLYDPCPVGWRVAPAAAYANAAITNTPVAGDETKYGWTLRDGNSGSEGLFIGAGRRIYTNGSIQNVFIPATRAELAQPWVGLYWTADMDGAQSKVLNFWFEKSTTEAGIEQAAAYGRANGMQVRCVKAN